MDSEKLKISKFVCVVGWVCVLYGGGLPSSAIAPRAPRGRFDWLPATSPALLEGWRDLSQVVEGQGVALFVPNTAFSSQIVHFWPFRAQKNRRKYAPGVYIVGLCVLCSGGGL